MKKFIMRALPNGLFAFTLCAVGVGLPQMATSQVQVTNIVAGSGHGISIGSEASNGVNNVTIQNVRYTNTSYGFRIKTARDRGNQIYLTVLRQPASRGSLIETCRRGQFAALW